MANEVEIYQQRKRERQEQSALVDAPVAPETPLAVDQYVVRKEENRKQNAAAAALIVENSGNPDQNAADDQLAREYQTTVNPDVTPPPSFVATYRDQLAAEVSRTKTTQTLSSSPMLTRWLDNTANARVAADDVSVLANIEAGLGHLRNALKRGIVDRSMQVGSQIIADTSVWLAGERGLTFEDRFKDARGEHYGYGFFGKSMEPGAAMKPDGTVDLPKIQEMGDEPVTAFFKAATGTAADFVTGLFGNTREADLARAAQFQQFAAQAAQNAADTPVSPTAQRALSAFQSDEPLSLGEAAQRALDLAVNDPGALAAMIAEVGIESTGAMIPAAIATAATRNPAVGAAVMGGTSYGIERNLTPVEFFASKGYDLTKPEDVQRMLANPDLMAEAAQKGHTRGLIIGALDWVSGGVAGRVLAKNPVADAALQSMIQASLGGGGEGFAQYATEGEVNFGDVIVEALAEFSTAPIEVAAIGARKFGEQQQAATRAEAAAPLLDELSQAAQESKLRTRSPAAFADYIANATRGGEMETMYFPSQEFIGYFQSQGVSLETVAEILPGVDLEQVRRAAVTGEDITMPTSTYMERVAGSDMDAFVLENSKFAPQDMTRAEAAAFREDERVREAQVAGEQQVARLEREIEATATEALQADIAEQLVAAGRPRQAAQQEAQLYPAFYNALASRMGITVEELMKTYRPPTVRGAEVSPLQAKQVDGLTRDMAGIRARASQRATTPKAALPKKVRAELDGIVASVRTALAGVDINTGVTERSAAFDGVAASWKRAGELVEPRTTEEINALPMPERKYRAQLRGALGALRNAVQRDGKADVAEELAALDAAYARVANMEKAQADEYLDTVEQAVRDAGLDPATATDDEVRAVLNPEGKAFFQSAAPEDSAAFREWAGTDEVIEASDVNDFDFSGEGPFVMRAFHGTTHEFDTFNAGKRGQKEGQFGAVNYFTTGQRDVEENYAGEGPDLTQRIEKRTEQLADSLQEQFEDKGRDKVVASLYRSTGELRIASGVVADMDDFDAAMEIGRVLARRELKGGDGKVMEVFVRTEKPFVVGGDTDVWAEFTDAEATERAAMERVAEDEDLTVDEVQERRDEFEGQIDEARWDIEADTPNALTTAVENVAARFDLDPAEVFGDLFEVAADGTVSHTQLEATLRASEQLGYAEDPETGDLIGFHVMAELIRELGFDSIILKNADQRFKNMDMEEGTAHIHVFDENNTNIKSATDNSGAYDRNDARIYNQSAAPDTPAFKKWFGDSKVVDENGDPLVVYHGTAAKAFDTFHAHRPNFFTANSEYAEGYNAKGDGKSRVVEAYLAIEKPFDPSNDEEARRVFNEDFKAYLGRRFPRKLEAFEPLEEGQPLSFVDADVVFSFLRRRAEETPGSYDGMVVSEAASGAFGVSFVPLSNTQIKSATDNSGAFDPTNPNMYQQETRGRISIPANGVASGAAVIDLFQKADLSTFLHESGHFFLTVLQDAATQPNAPQQVRDMYAQATSWWRGNADAVAADAGNGVTAADVATYLDKGTTGDAAKDAAVDTGMQEQWARAFETYLLEGKAPTAALRGAFEQFRAWLMEVYRKVKGNLNVRVTDDIRQVFDRLLATDAEISKANVDNNGAMLAKTAAELGVSEADYQKLAALHQEAQDEAAARAIADAMEPIRRMREAEYKARHAAIRTEVENEVNARPVYRAIEWMGNKRWLGGEATELPNGMRLNKEQLVERYGPGVLRTLPRGSFRVYTPEGMDIDEAAGWFGFSSGDELVRAMEQAPRREDVIANETDNRAMAELNQQAGTVDAAFTATEAFHNDKRGDYIAAELRTLNIGLGGVAARTSTASYARQVAKRTIGGMKARDAIASNRYLAAERRAAEQAQAAFAAGDRTKAADFKRQQLFNHMMFTESRRVADEVGKTERLAKRLASPGTRKNLAKDYLGAIDDVLEQYDFRKQGPGKEARRERMLAYIEKMKDAGRENEIAIPQHIIDNARAEPYMTLTVDRLRGVHDTLKNIESTARRAQKLIDAKSERDMDQIVADFGDAFAQNVKFVPPSRVETKGERFRNKAREYLDVVLNADTLLREIDGFSDVEGPAYINLKRGIDEATSRLQVRRQQAAADFEKLYGVYTVKERNQMAVATFVPELNTSMAKWDMISMVLNMGNADNIQRMTDPKVKGSFTKAQLDAVLGRMDKRDMDFVQSVWDYVDSFYAEIAARELRTTGVAPQKVEAQTLTTPHGEYKGGYYPLKYDPRLSDRVNEETADEVMNNMRAGRFGKAQTRNGHTKERAQSSGRAIMLDIGVLHSHINTVLHDLEMSEQVTNTWRILQEPRIKGMFLDSGKQVDHKALEMWVQDAASGQVNSADVISKTARFLKSGFTVSKLAFNLSTVAVQITGVAQSMVVIGKKDFTKGAATYLRNPLQTSQDVLAKSNFMAERETTFNKDIYDIMGDVKVGPKAGLYKRAMQKYIGPASFYLMQKVQFYAVDMPTWLGAYQKGLRTTGNDEAASIQYADRMVARAQASGIFSDRSPIERGTLTPTIRQNDFVRMFTALGSYMFAKANVAYERTGKTDFRSPKEVLSYTVDMVLLFTVEAILYNAIKGALPGMGGDDDDENVALEWAKFLAAETGLSIMSTMPFVRDLASPLQGFSGGGSYGSISETLTKPFLQAAQGEVDKAFVKSMVDSTGMLLHLPASQVNRFIDAGWRASEGEDVAPIEYIMGKR
jgi:hypothetical protein